MIIYHLYGTGSIVKKITFLTESRSFYFLLIHFLFYSSSFGSILRMEDTGLEEKRGISPKKNIFINP